METVYFGRNEHYSRGIELYDNGIYAEAIAEFQRVLDTTTEGAPERRLASHFLGESYTNLGLAHLHMNMYRKAEEELKFALMLHPEYADLHYHLAVVYYKMGRYDDALYELRAAQDINPKFARALIYTGLCELRSGKDSGLADVANAVAAQPAYDGHRYAAALEAYRSGDRDEAIRLFEQVAETDVDRIGDLLDRGMGLIQERDYESARETFAEAVSICPHYPDLRHYLGVCYMHLRMVDEAVVEFTEALELNPGYAAARVNLAIALARSGRIGEGREHLVRLLKTNPDNYSAARLLKVLQKA